MCVLVLLTRSRKFWAPTSWRFGSTNSGHPPCGADGALAHRHSKAHPDPAPPPGGAAHVGRFGGSGGRSDWVWPIRPTVVISNVITPRSSANLKGLPIIVVLDLSVMASDHAEQILTDRSLPRTAWLYRRCLSAQCRRPRLSLWVSSRSSIRLSSGSRISNTASTSRDVAHFHKITRHT